MAGPWDQYSAPDAAPAPQASPSISPQGPWASYAGGAAAKQKLGPRDVPDMPAPRQAVPDASVWDSIKAAPETALSMASAIPAGFAGNVSGIGHALFGGGYGTPAGARNAQQAAGSVSQAMTYQPRQPAAQEQLQAIAQALSASKLEGMGPMALPASQAAARGVPAASRSAAGTAREALPELGVGGIPKPPKAPDMKQTLAAKAVDEGIPLRPDMLSNNRFMKMAGEASEKVPLSGGKADVRQTAFNKAVARTIGADAEKITPDVYAATMNKYGEMIGDISAKNPVPLDAKLKSALEQHAFNATQFETGDVAKVVGNYVRELTENGLAKGQIDGVAFRKLRTKLTGQMRRTTNGDLKHALSELDDTMLDALEAQLSPLELKQFTQARGFYRNGKAIEPLVAKGSGDISPAALMARVTSDAGGKTSMAKGTRGDLGDLARIGQQFLKEPASSGTAERALTYGVLGGSAAIEPMTATGIYGAANVYNRMAPWMARRMIGKQGEIPQPPR